MNHILAKSYKVLGVRNKEVHHLAFKVENIQKALEEIKGKGIMLIDENPIFGAENSEFAFIYARIKRAFSLICATETNLRGEENEQN